MKRKFFLLSCFANRPQTGHGRCYSSWVWYFAPYSATWTTATTTDTRNNGNEVLLTGRCEPLHAAGGKYLATTQIEYLIWNKITIAYYHFLFHIFKNHNVANSVANFHFRQRQIVDVSAANLGSHWKSRTVIVCCTILTYVQNNANIVSIQYF